MSLVLSGCGVTPIVSANTAGNDASLLISTNVVSFGSVLVGETATATVTATNAGSSAIQINNIQVTGQGFSQAGIGSFPVSVAKGGFYTVKVQFDPTAEGTLTGTLTVNASSETAKVALSGSGDTTTGAPSSLSCNQNAMSGSGSDACTVSLMAAAGSGGFTVGLSSNNAAISVPSSVTVAAGDTAIGFAANVSSVSSAQTVTLTASAGGVAKTYAIDLNAEGPGLTPHSTSVAFGDIYLNSPATQLIILTSSGTAPVTISAASISGGPGFSIAGPSFPLTIPAGQTAMLYLQFDPTSSGSVNGGVTLTTNTSAGNATISLSGTGQAAPGVLSGVSCASGSMTGAGTDVCKVTLTAPDGSGGLTVGLVSSTTAVTVPASITVPAGASSAEFAATVTSVTRAQSAILTATAGSSATESFTLQLNAAVPTLTIDAISIPFGDVVVNTAATQPATVTSTGTAPVTLIAAALIGAGFSLSAPALPVTLNPSQAAILYLQFDPSAAGAATGQLTITSNSSVNPIAVIGLSGTGTAATGATTYYVDNCVTVGNDSNNGTSTSTPWLTIAHVNAHRYNPGDSVLFRHTCTWREELIPPSSGSSGNPITFGAYGTGTAPIINGANLVTSWTASNAGTYYASAPSTSTLGLGSLQVFEDGTRLIQETAGVSSLAPGQWYLNTTNSRIFIYTFSGDDPSGHTMEVSVRQDCIESGEYSDYVAIQNLMVKNAAWTGVTFNNYSQAIHYISITGVTAEDNYADGINVYGSPGSGYSISNVIISGNATSGNGGPGIDVWTDSNTISDVSITGNIGHDDVWNPSAAPNSPNGEIHVYGPTLSGLTIEYNLAYNAGSALPDFKAYPNRYDIGSGIYIDTVPSKAVIAYNQVYNNNDDGIALEDTQDAAIYGNVSYNNGVAGFSNYRLSSSNLWYNNTAYGNALGFQLWGGGTDDNQLVNNIVVASTASALVTISGGENDGTNGDGNVYIYNDFGPQANSFIQWGSGVFYSTYSSWEAATGNCGLPGCSHSVETMPLFVNTSTNNFALAPSSPTIDTGLNLGSTYKYGLGPASTWPSNVILDNQNDYGSGWDIGAYVYTQTPAPQ
jgi:hypothetical protein